MDRIQLFEIPAGTVATPCKSCRARIFWVRTPTGRRLPLRTEPNMFNRKRGETLFAEGAKDPTSTTPGYGWAHFIDCPQADFHRKPRR